MKKKIWWILPIVAAVALAACVSAFWIQLMMIQGESMGPTYKNMQIVAVNKRIEQNSLKEGDVVAFYCEGLDAVLVKRIVALPNQKVVIKNKTLYVDNNPSPLYKEGMFDYSGKLGEEMILSSNEYIVIGDNVAESKDSRYNQVGPIQFQNIVGKVIGQ